MLNLLFLCALCGLCGRPLSVLSGGRAAQVPNKPNRQRGVKR